MLGDGWLDCKNMMDPNDTQALHTKLVCMNTVYNCMLMLMLMATKALELECHPSNPCLPARLPK